MRVVCMFSRFRAAAHPRPGFADRGSRHGGMASRAGLDFPIMNQGRFLVMHFYTRVFISARYKLTIGRRVRIGNPVVCQ